MTVAAAPWILGLRLVAVPRGSGAIMAINTNTAHVVVRRYSNGVDSWDSIIGIYLDEQEAEAVEINLLLRNNDPNVEYLVTDYEIGKEY